MLEHAPNTLTTLVYVILSLILVACNGFFVAAEFAIVKVRRTRLKELEGKGSEAARISIMCVDQMDEFLSATQLGITLVSLGLGWVGEESFYNLLTIIFPDLVQTHAPHVRALALGASFFLITLLHVVLGELVPKSMAIQRAEQVTLFISKPLNLFYRFAKPLIIVFTVLANKILKVLGYGRLEEEALSEEELKMVLQESHEEGVISASEAEIIKQAFEFSDKRARDIMIPEHQVQFIAMDRTFEENLEVIDKRLYTRFPLVKNSFQNILGVVHVKDALFEFSAGQQNDLFTRIARPPVFIYPGMRQDKILRILKEKRTHLAIVQEPATRENIGIVALEDILEDLVGEMIDEHGN